MSNLRNSSNGNNETRADTNHNNIYIYNIVLFASFIPSCMCNTHSHQKAHQHTSFQQPGVRHSYQKTHHQHISSTTTTYCTTWPSTHEACPRWRPLVHFGHRREIPSCQLGRTVVLPLLLCFTIFYSILLCCASCFTLICSLFHYALLHLILMSSLFSSVVFPVLLCSLDFLSLTPSVSSCILCFALSVTLHSHLKGSKPKKN